MIQPFLLDIYPKELKTGIQTNSCTEMFIAAQFAIAKGGNNPDVLQQVNELGCVLMDIIQSQKRNKIVYTTMKLNLKNIMLPEISQTKKVKYCICI